MSSSDGTRGHVRKPKSGDRRALEAIRAGWGHEVRRDRDHERISNYHRLLAQSGTGQEVDENTWLDLNMNSLFDRMDRNASRIGSQYLYHLLHVYADDAELAERASQYRYFAQQANLREEILLQVSRLQHAGAQFIPQFLFQEMPARPRAFLLIYLSSFLAILSTALIAFAGVFVIPMVVLIAINLLVSVQYGRRVGGIIPDVSSLSLMLDVGIRLSNVDDTELSQLNELRGLRSTSLNLHRKIGWLTIDESRLDDLSRIARSYLNCFYLFHLVAYVRSIDSIRNEQANLRRVFELVASLDATISIASYLEEMPFHCRPQFNTKNTIAVDDIYHPLIADPVPNAVRLQDKSALITGSNMAGKTTFIRTIGLNIILGQTIATCLARAADIPRAVVKTSIRRTDDLGTDKSYYFREIEAVLEFMELGERRHCFLFIIDEIFRGTNTIERISAATSVLKRLARDNMALVTTHDVELQDLLAEHFVMYHFGEQIEEERLFFDYRIRGGPTSSRNAIRLLGLKGYPPEVVREARELAEKLAETGRYEWPLDWPIDLAIPK